MGHSWLVGQRPCQINHSEQHIMELPVPWSTTQVVFLTTVAAGILCTVAYHQQKKKTARYPPCYSGWIPWLGCALEFGKDPIHFINKAMKKMGPVFTLKMAGKRMTFLMDPDDFHYFFHSPHVDFQMAVQKPVNKTANISPSSFLAIHTIMHDKLKWKLAPAQLEPFCKSLGAQFSQELDKRWGEKGEGDLCALIRGTMYVVVLDSLFGENVLPTEQEDAFRLLERHFVNFDDGFEYGSQLPEMFVNLVVSMLPFRDWSQSKWWLLSVFHGVVKEVKRKNTAEEDEVHTIPEIQMYCRSVFESLIRVIGKDDCAPNFGLLTMWASLANAIPITFWTMAMILSHPEVTMELKGEVSNAVKSTGKDVSHFTLGDFQKMPFLKRCVMEAIRLRAPGVITRGVAESFTIRGYTIPKGDHLMLSPYWTHRDERFFPEPDKFIPDRWMEDKLAKGGFLEGFVAFGGGRYQCPGRWFGILEIQILVAMLMHNYDVTLLDEVPEPSTLHLVGTQQPVGRLRVEYTRVQCGPE